MKLKRFILSLFFTISCFTASISAQTVQMPVNTNDKTKVLIYVLIGIGALAVLGVILLMSKKNKK